MNNSTNQFNPTEELSHFVALLGAENYNALNKAIADAGQRVPKDEDGLTLAHHAAAFNDTKGLSVLQLNGICVDEPDCSGTRPVHLAAQNDALEAFVLLESAECSTTARNLRCESPKDLARGSGAVKVLSHMASGRRNGLFSRLFTRNQAAAA